MVAAHSRSAASRAVAVRASRAIFSATISSRGTHGRAGSANPYWWWVGSATKSRGAGASQHGGPTSSLSDASGSPRSLVMTMRHRPRLSCGWKENGPSDTSDSLATTAASSCRSSRRSTAARSMSVENRPAVPANSLRNAVPPLNVTRSKTPRSCRCASRRSWAMSMTAIASPRPEPGGTCRLR